MDIIYIYRYLQLFLFPACVLASILQGHIREAIYYFTRVRVQHRSVFMLCAQTSYSHAALQGRQDRTLQSGCQGEMFLLLRNWFYTKAMFQMFANPSWFPTLVGSRNLWDE